MEIVSRVKSLFTGDDYTLPPPDSSLVMESFVFEGFLYIRTPTKYFMKPFQKRLFKKTSKSNFDYQKSAYKTMMNRSQAKGLLRYQLELPL
jgi:hypothetical protein